MLLPLKQEEVYMIPDCNGSSTFLARVVDNSINVVIWNKAPLMRLQICL
jgi:hypothetical protein